MLSNLGFGGALLKLAESKNSQIALSVIFMFRTNVYI